MRVVPASPDEHVNRQPIVPAEFFQRIARVRGIAVPGGREDHAPMRRRELRAPPRRGVMLEIGAGHALKRKVAAKPAARQVKTA